MHIVESSHRCPHCNEVMNGPITKYKKRETELYFDLEKKYEHCPYCGLDVEVVDFQVLMNRIASKIPPHQARSFSMKTERLFESIPRKTVRLLSAILSESQEKVVIPVDNLVCLESLYCKLSESDYHCSMCIHKMKDSLDSRSTHLNRPQPIE